MDLADAVSRLPPGNEEIRRALATALTVSPAMRYQAFTDDWAPVEFLTVATEIADAGQFWPGEDYHQRYLEKRGLWSCHTR